MTVYQLISELDGLASRGYGYDKVLLTLSTENGYVYQELLSVVPYDDERKIGLIGDKNTTDDRREDQEWITD